MILLHGKQINLRDLRLDDLDDYAHWQHPDHAWHRLDGPYYEKSKAEDIPPMMEKIRGRVSQGDFPTPRTRLFIVDQAEDRLLGSVSWYWIGEETNWLAQGIVIFDEAYWQRGIGYEAFGLWSQYLFDNMPQIARLDLRTWSGNHGMMGLARKLGYQEEARFRKARVVDGEYYDGLGFGILREEWASRYPQGFAKHLSAWNSLLARTHSLRLDSSNDALDVMTSGLPACIFHVEDLHPEFFDFKNGLAGEVFQKFVNYDFKIAIVLPRQHEMGRRVDELIIDHRRHSHIRFFETDEQAYDWLE